MFFESFAGLLRVVIISVAAYAALIAVLRVSGKRTLSKMNAFDFVVTVALGSTFATVILSKDVALAEGVTAFAMLALLQFVTSWLSVRSELFEEMVKSEPTLLFHNGNYLEQAIRRQRISKVEILQALRKHGVSWENTHAVVLETDGGLSVVPKPSDGQGSESPPKELSNVVGENEAKAVS